ncbi:calcium channel YVC1 [Echria macrotheca]|uniref:Calcium channel YVC1 n=1 Tax=Echria macrotheca TaxID=438768 RepID=A0AAJ0F083_9PEZI|nr:calcium channel YVC1 [Echria macrotheca]
MFRPASRLHPWFLKQRYLRLYGIRILTPLCLEARVQLALPLHYFCINWSIYFWPSWKPACEMPLRVKSRPLSQADPGLRTPSPQGRQVRFGPELPDITVDDTFREVVKKLSTYIAETVQLPSTFEQLRTTGAGDGLRALVDHLSRTCTHPAIVNALLALKWHYGASSEDKGLSDARANACEIVAWRFLTHLSEREAVDFCLYEIPEPSPTEPEQRRDEEEGEVDENSALLAQVWSGTSASARRVINQTGSSRRNMLLQSISRLTMSMAAESDDDEEEDDPTAPFTNLNALEIAAIADAKRFLSQTVVQKIVTGIWNGDIIFWDNLSVHAVKKPRFYNRATADPFSRLRVPKYLKAFEVVFFASFLFLYYYVLVERNPYQISTTEIFLYLWFAAFTYDELSEWIDAGSIFYTTDVWNIFDIIMLIIGLGFFVLRIIGLRTNDDWLIGLAFDILALEALFMVPRVCSILSLSPYWGTLIPCLKEMGKDFVKFMVLVVVIYMGFLTTFSLIGRDSYTFRDMVWFLTKIFLGSSYVGFDIMKGIDPIFGPPLMLLFIMLSSILLMGSLTGMLSNSFSRVITHAREEYLYVYSVYVLEASTSNRLTHFYPPFNLLALVIFRPLRLFLPSDDKFRNGRIFLLKATHLPIVAAIEFYEWVRGTSMKGTQYNGFRGPVHAIIASPAPPQRKWGRSPGRVQQHSSTSSLRPGSANPAAMSSVTSLIQRQAAAAEQAAEERAFGEPVSDVEVRIADLASKIDRLTEMLVAMQASQSKSLAEVSVA